ncbi:MAG: hypothetical protein V3S41_04615 [Spirochaetia bacterium]
MRSLRERYYRALFLIGAIYDLVLGIIFTFFFRFAFDLLGIAEKLPTHGAYISLIGVFLFVIGVAYAIIFAGDLQKNRGLIAIGALYKLAYCSTALYYFLAGDVPHMIFVTLFGVADFVFFVLMTECWLYVRKSSR